MTPNPFENAHSPYIALVNHEGQYSIWPAGTQVPGGWTRVFGPDGRGECLDYIENAWTDMRPVSLIQAMGEPPPQR